MFLSRILKVVGRVAVDLLLAYVAMEVCRLVFLWENHGFFHLTWDSWWLISKGGLLFDTSAILYGNALWLLLVFLPVHVKERPWWWKMERVVFTVCNSLLVLANLCDTAFFAFRQQRTTMDIFREFGGEGNLGNIFGAELLSHWYLVLLFILMVWGLWAAYRQPVREAVKPPLKRYYISFSILLGLSVLLFIWGVRGCTLSAVTRPITIGYAQRFATEPIDVGLTLNTPFAMLRTGKSGLEIPEFYSEEEIAEVYSPIHQGVSDGPLKGYNVVIMVLESFGREFSCFLNPQFKDYKG